MVWLTHVAVAAATGAAAGVGQAPASLACCAAGALLPDLDHPGSVAGRAVPGSRLGRLGRVAAGGLLLALGVWSGEPLAALAGAGVALLGALGHRGLTHSLAGLALACLFCRVIAPGLEAPLGWGWATHLLLDGLTPSGVPLLWPWGWRLRGPVRTGGLLDRALGLAVAGVLLAGRGLPGLPAGLP